ncbi:MFS transporter [Desulfovibrio sp. X2]|uniref:MFS transporter n=1 Tax=Desulfovibrio sp. X2 TaxID=941449 RepID=UPI001F363710|nr:MFS transporter [Desulfovibrio sp. X2]
MGEDQMKTDGTEDRRGSRRLPAAIVTLGWVSFFTDVASEMIYPVVPLFLTSVLGAPVVVLGAMEGAAEALVSLMKGFSGWHCDRMGRRTPYVRAGYGLATLSKPMLALAFGWPMVFLARMVDRLGKGLRTTARDTMIAEAAPPAVVGRAFGFHRAMDTAGAAVGVLLAMGLLAVLPGRYRLIFLLAALPGLAAVRLTFRLRDRTGEGIGDRTGTAPSETSAACGQPASRSPGAALRGLPRGYWQALALLGLFAFANSTDTLLVLRAKSLGLSDVQVMAAYLLFNLTYALSAYPAGIASDRFGRWRMMLSGWGLYALVYLGFATASGPAWPWLLFPAYGLYMGLTEGVGKAIVAAGLPAERKGTAMGLFLMATGFMTLLGSLAGGLAWDLIGPRAPFVLGGATAVAALGAGLAVRLFSARDA